MLELTFIGRLYFMFKYTDEKDNEYIFSSRLKCQIKVEEFIPILTLRVRREARTLTFT